MLAFVAKDHAEVEAFYKAAVAAGGKSKEALKLGSNTIPAIMRHGCSILTATTSSRS